MKKDNDTLSKILSDLPPEVKTRTKLSIAIAERIAFLMRQKGLNKKQFAEALDRRPSEITKWLSGEHNFTISSISKISAFFDAPIIEVAED